MKNYNFKKNISGFTMMETVVYLAIVGIVATAFISFSLTIVSIRNKNYAQEETEANIRAVINLISQKIREADDVVLPASGGQDTALVLDNGVNPEITFNLDDGQIMMTEGAGQAIAITSNEIDASVLEFSNLAQSGDKDSIKINLTFDFKNNDSLDYEHSSSIQTAISLRK